MGHRQNAFVSLLVITLLEPPFNDQYINTPMKQTQEYAKRKTVLILKGFNDSDTKDALNKLKHERGHKKASHKSKIAHCLLGTFQRSTAFERWILKHHQPTVLQPPVQLVVLGQVQLIHLHETDVVMTARFHLCSLQVYGAIVCSEKSGKTL
jgi:hypothetical protein